MEYLQPGEAQTKPGLRLALTAHVPGPFSMSAKAVFEHHRVPYDAVEQVGGGQNEDLVAWTGHRNAPVAVYNDEAPRVGWLEILNLAERLGSGESLMPDDIDTRMAMIGFINELIGENGWVWNLRLVMLGAGGPESALKQAERNPMYADYGYSEDAHERALEHAQTIQNRFCAYAKTRQNNYLAGDRLSALDIYWAYFSLIASPLPHEDCPMPKGLRRSYELSSEALGECDPVLIEQRDWILDHHLSLPMTF